MWSLRKYKWYRALLGGDWYYNRTKVPDGLKYQFGPYTYQWSRKWYPLHKQPGTWTMTSETYFNGKRIYHKEFSDSMISYRIRRRFSFSEANYQKLLEPRPWDDDPMWPL